MPLNWVTIVKISETWQLTGTKFFTMITAQYWAWGHVSAVWPSTDCTCHRLTEVGFKCYLNSWMVNCSRPETRKPGRYTWFLWLCRCMPSGVRYEDLCVPQIVRRKVRCSIVLQAGRSCWSIKVLGPSYRSVSRRGRRWPTIDGNILQHGLPTQL